MSIDKYITKLKLNVADEKKIRIKEKELLDLESQIGVSLPCDYRQFLKEWRLIYIVLILVSITISRLLAALAKPLEKTRIGGGLLPIPCLLLRSLTTKQITGKYIEELKRIIGYQ